VDAVLNSTSNGALDATLNNITFDVILVDTLGTMLNVTLDATFLSYFESYFGPYFERARLFPLLGYTHAIDARARKLKCNQQWHGHIRLQPREHSSSTHTKKRLAAPCYSFVRMPMCGQQGHDHSS